MLNDNFKFWRIIMKSLRSNWWKPVIHFNCIVAKRVAYIIALWMVRKNYWYGHNRTRYGWSRKRPFLNFKALASDWISWEVSMKFFKRISYTWMASRACSGLPRVRWRVVVCPRQVFELRSLLQKERNWKSTSSCYSTFLPWVLVWPLWRSGTTVEWVGKLMF